jgi:hypothetical protein
MQTSALFHSLLKHAWVGNKHILGLMKEMFWARKSCQNNSFIKSGSSHVWESLGYGFLGCDTLLFGICISKFFEESDASLKIEAAGSSKTVTPIYQTTRHHILEGHILATPIYYMD